VFKECVSEMLVQIRKRGNPTRETAENHDTVKQTVGS
jgi:hypothetical protein